jgi:tetratricopeptide (TPR) repeat protein
MLKKIAPVFTAAILGLVVFTSCGKAAIKNNIESSGSSSLISSSAPTSSSVSSQPVNASSTGSSYPDPEKDPLYVRAYSYYAADKFDDAVNVCNQALAANPNCFWAYNVKGIAVYFANGNSVADSCLALIDKSIAINPNYSYGYFNKALIEKGLKENDESISDFNKVLSLKPGDTWSYYGISTIYADTNQTELALQYLKLAIDTNPSAVKAQVKDDIYRHFSVLKNDPRFQALVNGNS